MKYNIEFKSSNQSKSNDFKPNQNKRIKRSEPIKSEANWTKQTQPTQVHQTKQNNYFVYTKYIYKPTQNKPNS